MNVAFALCLVINVLQFKESVQDCRVLADCNDGEARWKTLLPGIPGKPGKRGPPGPVGQRGEPGIGANMTELKEYLDGENRGPKLYYFAPSLTWDSSKTFCERFNRDLCTYDDVCPVFNGGRKFIRDVIPGDHWAAVLDSHNEWVEIGDYHVWPCRLHKSQAPWNVAPSWGTTTKEYPHKGYVYCCEKRQSVEQSSPDVKYQYIGKSATYTSSQAHCESQDRRLCYASEVCVANKPVLGSLIGNKWVAVRDRHNEWVQVGVSGATCRHHGVHHGLPGWGLRTDGSLLNHVGYVFCCRNT